MKFETLSITTAIYKGYPQNVLCNHHFFQATVLNSYQTNTGTFLFLNNKTGYIYINLMILFR